MKPIPIIYLLTAVVFTVGCGVRNAQRSQPVVREEPSVTVAAASPVDSDSKNRSVREPARRAERQETVTPDRPPRPQIKFTHFESEHVRVAGVNPLPDGGLLVLPLCDLQCEYAAPYRGKFLSAFGRRGNSWHTGIDVKCIPDDTIRAALPGVVRMSKPYSGYGNIVVIRHYCGIETVYAHNSKNLVGVNDAVEAGDPIALAGRTGRATTEHLHFEVRVAGEALNPVHLVDPETMSLRSDTLFVQSVGGKIVAYNSAREGQMIAENAYSAESKPVSGSGVASAGAQAAGSAQYYRVIKGDTLSQIARRHGTTIDALCKLNKLSRTSVLQINQRLRVK